MKLTLYIKHSPKNMGEKVLECFDFLESNGFSGYTIELTYKSDEYYRLLTLVEDKYPLVFDIYVEMTKKEMDKEKAFVLKPTSILSMKHVIGYGSDTKNPFIGNKKCFSDENDPFRICINPRNGIKGSIKWKLNYFKATEYDPELFITDDLKNLIEENDLTGFHFEQLGHLTKGIDEGVYCVTADALMRNDFIMDNLCCIKYRDDYQCKYIDYDGSLIYAQDSLENLRDISYTKKATSCEKGEIIVSQKFRQFYMQNKLKGIRFEPILEVATESFKWYNQTILELANDLIKHNSEHIIGQLNKIKPEKLLDGIVLSYTSNSPMHD